MIWESIKMLAKRDGLPLEISKNIGSLADNLAEALAEGTSAERGRMLRERFEDRLRRGGFFRDGAEIRPSSPADLILAYGNRLLYGRNGRIFEDLSQAAWEIRHGDELLGQCRAIEPRSQLEREILNTLIFTAMKLVELNAMTGKPKHVSEQVMRLEAPLLRGRELASLCLETEWDRRTCSYCFGRFPKHREKALEKRHMVSIGSRESVCPGLRFPPLEEDVRGNAYFWYSAETSIRQANAEVMMVITMYPSSSLSRKAAIKLRDSGETAREWDIRSFIMEGIEHAGDFKSFAGRKMITKMRAREYGTYLYGIASNLGGTDRLVLDAMVKLGEDSSAAFYCAWVQKYADSIFNFSMSGKKASPPTDPALAWLAKEIDIHDFFNAIEIYARADPQEPTLPWIKKFVPGFEKMPVESDE